MSILCQFVGLFTMPILRDDDGPLPMPGTLWQPENWSWEFSIVFPLFLWGIWYLIGAIRRGQQDGLTKHHVAFAAGWTALFLALVSPIHRLGDVLFSAHMLQHEVLLLIAAPLVSASHPAVTLLYAISRNTRQPIGSWIRNVEHAPPLSVMLAPLGAFLIHAAALWLWHIPYLYQATLESDPIHALQHLSFFLSGVLFWSALIGAGRSTMTYGASVLYVFGTAAHCSALGALLTFSSVIWYPIYLERTQLWKLTPLEDQQLGGLLMWIPSGVVFIVIGIWLFARWLTTSEQRLKHGTLAEIATAGKERA
ncbi:MAG TPA: cytochrome c oxidase assembly protein [Acidobacteriaceae bacterium]